MGQTWRKYYYAGAQRVGLRSMTSASDVLTYLHGDHLGSTSLTTSSTNPATVIAQTKYKAYGDVRSSTGTMPTDFQFTGQRVENATGGLYDYAARFYDPLIGRFISADTLVPNPGNPQDLNRYGYARNSPLRYTDPTGHCVPVCLIIGVALAVAVWEVVAPYNATPLGGDRVNAQGQPCGSSGCVSQGPSDFEVAGNVARDAALAYTVVRGSRVIRSIAAGLCFNDGDCTNEANATQQTLDKARTVFESSASQSGNLAFKSFDAFKRAMGPAGEGKQWHHIVEQRIANIEQFGAEAIHNTRNVVAVAREVNQAINNYYSSKTFYTGGLTVREWLSTQSYEEQFQFGQMILDRVLNGLELP